MFIALMAVVGAEPLLPRSKWKIDYGRDMCVLSRDYGADENGPTLGMTRSPMSDEWTFFLRQHRSKLREKREAGELLFKPGGRSVQALAQTWTDTDKSTMSMIDTHGADLLDMQATVAIGVMLQGKMQGKMQGWFAIDKVPAALKALSACNDDLLKAWHLDPTEKSRISVKAEPINPTEFYSPDDYPADALKAGKSGRVVVAYSITTDGMVADCRTVSSSGIPSLDAMSCDALVRRARYRPALGKDGKPMLTHLFKTVNWVVPRP